MSGPTRSPEHGVVRRGFTLVEVMISVFLFAIIFIAAMEFWMHAGREMKIGTKNAEILQKMRLSVNGVEDDIRAADEIIHFETTADYTNLQLARFKNPFDTTEVEYHIYTLYKSPVNLWETGQQRNFPFALARTKKNDRPAPTDLGLDLVLSGQKSSLTDNTVGIIDKWTDPVTNKQKECEIWAFNAQHDPYFQNHPYFAEADKMTERARTRYRGTYNGAMIGFTNPNDIVGVELRFLTQSDRGKVQEFHSFVYSRKKLYDTMNE